jgi:hypothetical protein
VEHERVIAVPVEVAERFCRGSVCDICVRFETKSQTTNARAQPTCNVGKWKCLDPSIVWMTTTQLAILKLEE